MWKGIQSPTKESFSLFGKGGDKEPRTPWKQGSPQTKPEGGTGKEVLKTQKRTKSVQNWTGNPVGHAKNLQAAKNWPSAHDQRHAMGMLDTRRREKGVLDKKTLEGKLIKWGERKRIRLNSGTRALADLKTPGKKGPPTR